jgi:hypothetical protein
MYGSSSHWEELAGTTAMKMYVSGKRYHRQPRNKITSQEERRTLLDFQPYHFFS